MGSKTIKFSKEHGADFHKILHERVKIYFDENKLSRHANGHMIFKTIFMLCLYFVPYFLMMTGTVTNPWLIWVCWVWMGVGMAGIGFSIMHDANHGAYSKNKRINNILGSALNLIGGNAIIWKIQHNVLHHTYTNIDGMDEDITPQVNFLRFSPHRKRIPIQKYQHIYAWFFYGIMTIFWISSKEFMQLARYSKQGLTKKFGNLGQLFLNLSIWKIMYYLYALVLPLFIISSPWWVIVIGFISMHFTTGIILGIVFQAAHVMPEMNFPVADEKGNMENNFAVHQLLTTTDFSPKSSFFSWFIGGLNFQIEHHLFPNICHVHYRGLSQIVHKTAQDFNLPYYCKKDFLTALKEHANMLYIMGHYDSYEQYKAAS